MQYGIDLTRTLTQRIQAAATAKGGCLVVFQTDTGAGVSDVDEV
jgi:hypothetical protein